LRCSIDGLEGFQDKPLASGRDAFGINTRTAEEVAYLRLRAVWPRRGVSAAGAFACSADHLRQSLERAVIKSLHDSRSGLFEVPATPPATNAALRVTTRCSGVTTHLHKAASPRAPAWAWLSRPRSGNSG